MAFSNLYRQLQFIHFIVDIIFCVLQKQAIILIQKTLLEYGNISQQTESLQ